MRPSYAREGGKCVIRSSTLTPHPQVSPVLIQRFSEREETVRLEVWSTYVTLLNATAVYGTLAASVPSGKRKRGDDEEMPPAGASPVDLLTEQVPALTKALLGQLRPPKVSRLAREGPPAPLLHGTLIWRTR